MATKVLHARDRVRVEPRGANPPIVSADEDVETTPATTEKLVPYEKLESDYGITFGRPHLWRLMRSGRFPCSVKLVDGGSAAWLHSELIQWIRSRPRAIAVARSTVKKS